MVGRPRVLGDEHAAGSEVEINWARQWGKNDPEGRFVTGSGLLEPRLEQIEPHVSWFRQEVAKAHYEECTTPTFRPVIAQGDDSGGGGMWIERVESFAVEAAVGAEVGNGQRERKAGRRVGSVRIGFVRP